MIKLTSLLFRRGTIALALKDVQAILRIPCNANARALADVVHSIGIRVSSPRAWEVCTRTKQRFGLTTSTDVYAIWILAASLLTFRYFPRNQSLLEVHNTNRAFSRNVQHWR